MNRVVSAALGICMLLLAANRTGSAEEPKAPQYLAFAFTSEQHGWAAGGAGIAVTNDGGHTWTPQYHGGRVDRLVFVHRRSVFALGGGMVLHTADDGNHWQAVGNGRPALRDIAFTSDRTGYGVGADGLLYQTADGAQSWQRGAFAKPVDAVCFSDKRNGYIGGATTAPALGAFDGIAATTDGGRNWSVTARPPTAGLVGIAGHALHCTRGSVYDLIDLGAHAGGGAYILARSTDGAHSWTPLATGGQVRRLRNVPQGPGSEATSMSGYSPTAAYVAGFCGACGEAGRSSFGGTVDAGLTWYNTTLDKIGFTSEPVFTTPTHGWIGARELRKDAPPSGDEVLETRDGGHKWAPIASAP